MANGTGTYNQAASRMPEQAKNESREAYLQRLKVWRQKQNRGGSKIQTGSPTAANGPNESKPQPKKESSGGWMDKVVRALSGGK